MVTTGAVRSCCSLKGAVHRAKASEGGSSSTPLRLAGFLGLYDV